MAAGTTYKQCGCRDGNGRRLGKKCLRLRRKDGAWSRDHGSWYYQLELPAHPDGSRRTPLRHGGFASRAAAQQELNQARELLAIPLPGDQDGRRRIADLLGRSVRTGGGLPDAATVCHSAIPSITRSVIAVIVCFDTSAPYTSARCALISP